MWGCQAATKALSRDVGLRAAIVIAWQPKAGGPVRLQRLLQTRIGSGRSIASDVAGNEQGMGLMRA